ncbi:unnamed protein product, partial [Adineta steineri]
MKSYLFTGASNVPIVYSKCNCGSSWTCTQSSQGMMTGCYPLESLLQTTLRCFYNQSCIDSTQKFTQLNISSLKISQYRMSTTIQSILNNLMVAEYIINKSYENYFNQCALSSCSYNYMKNYQVTEGIINIISLYSGLMMLIVRSLIILLVGFSTILQGVHFRGGTITWRPLNNTPSGSTVAVQIRERYSWNRITYPCDDATIALHGTLGGGTYVTYVSGTSGFWTNMNTAINCTDYSVALIVSSGEHYETQTFPLNIFFSIGFVNGNWLTNLVVGGNNQGWSVVCRVNTVIRPDGYINSSPIAVSLPIVYKEINIQQVHVVQMSDFDGTDTLRCRWANKSGNFNGADECDGVCYGIPGASLIEDNCTLVFTLTNAGVY